MSQTPKIKIWPFLSVFMALAVEQSETAMMALIDREARGDRWHGCEIGAVLGSFKHGCESGAVLGSFKLETLKWKP